MEANKSVKNDTFLGVFQSFWKSINQWQDISNIKTQLRNFSKLKKWLNWRANWVKTSLENIWIKAEALTKQELVRFLTDYYNPKLDSLESIWDIENYNITK
jgi:hypothetical protein